VEGAPEVPKQQTARKGENGQKRTRDPQRTRQNIVEASAELFAQKGLDGTSIREIAGKSGESLSNIYYYFDDKTDLFRTVMMEVALEGLTQVMAAELDQRGSAEERLRRVAKAYADMTAGNPRAAMMVVQALLRILDQKEPPMIQLFEDRLRKVEGIIEEGIKRGEIRQVDPRRYSNFIIGMVIVNAFNGVASQTVDQWPGTAFSPSDFEAFFDETIIKSLEKT
jgi:TetR/AcrR family transcriptional regulator, cholesterol catabolism regulator